MRKRSWRFKNLTGMRFTRLTVMEEFVHKTDQRTRWICRCDCGNVVTVLSSSLATGNTKSCGCYQKDNPSNLSHGMTGSPEYRAWENMRQRCHRKESVEYHRYGGRGITVCDRWLLSFEDFFLDVGKRPSELHTLDRINNNGHYEPGNVRWATRKEQSANVCRNVNVKINGVTKILSEWCRIYGISKNTVRNRIKNMNWCAETAITTKVKSGKRVDYDN